ncbi:signal transduction histidine kinase [Flammeovirgaceae bacterium 311]|nr:signal transduction histidine kinase [Flammeovirgaceae bacterium 311]
MSLEAVNKTNWRSHLLGMFLLSLGLTILNVWGRVEEPAGILRNFMYTFTVVAAMWIGNGWITDWLDARISWVEKPSLRFSAGVLLMVLYTTGIYVLIIETIEWVNEQEFSRRTYLQSLLVTMSITAIISVVLHAREFLLNWRQAAIDKERLEKAHVASQYDSLRNQVNPHFLFNSLNVLSELVHQDADEAERFVRQLGRVYRYVLEKREVEVVPLQEELEFLRSYLFLHEIRQPNTLQVEWPQQVGEEEGVPPLALQLLAENALKHNVLDAKQPLRLVLRKENSWLVVENKLQRRTIPASGTGVGLSNLTNRYKYLTDRAVGIEETEGCFKVSLPLLKLPKA